MSLHHCGFPARDYDKPEDPYAGLWGKYGFAIEDCREREDGTLWVDNGEYENRVNYCPICGYPAKNKMMNTDFVAIKDSE